MKTLPSDFGFTAIKQDPIDDTVPPLAELPDGMSQESVTVWLAPMLSEYRKFVALDAIANRPEGPQIMEVKRVMKLLLETRKGIALLPSRSTAYLYMRLVLHEEGKNEVTELAERLDSDLAMMRKIIAEFAKPLPALATTRGRPKKTRRDDLARKIEAKLREKGVATSDAGRFALQFVLTCAGSAPNPREARSVRRVVNSRTK